MAVNNERLSFSGGNKMASIHILNAPRGTLLNTSRAIVIFVLAMRGRQGPRLAATD